jgi:hypothetical protein
VMTSLEKNVSRNPEISAIYEDVLADIERALPGATADRRVRDTVASALAALRATGQSDREVLYRYAQYHKLAFARLTPKT